MNMQRLKVLNFIKNVPISESLENLYDEYNITDDNFGTKEEGFII